MEDEGINLRFCRLGKMFASFVEKQDIIPTSTGIASTTLAAVVGDFVDVDSIVAVADVDS